MRLLFNKGFLFYAEFNLRLFLLLLISKKDILYANDMDTLLPNYVISKIVKKKLIFDSHELFSEIPELTNRIRVKNFWLSLEKWLIPKLKNVITVSESIKRHYTYQYGISATVIRNLPLETKAKKESFPFSIKNKKIILYQGSINIGRGLELMIETMRLLDDYILVIIGDGDILESLEEKVLTEQLERKVKFLGKVLPEKLKKLTPNADIGISLEEDLGLNYRYALPNKVFDYIHAEIPVIVSDLPEMKKLIRNYRVGEVLTERTSETLAKIIISMKVESYAHHLKKAKKQLNWSQEKKQLISTLQSLE